MVTAIKVNTNPGYYTEAFADLEWRKCKISLLYYLTNYVWIQDRIGQQIIRWQKEWAHLLELVDLVQGWRDAVPRHPLYILIFKSRQVGATTTLTGIANWLLHFHESTKVEYQSEGEDVANEMADRNRFISEHHPEWLKLSRLPDQKDLIGFPASHGRLVAMPSTESAGRTSDATLIVCDEWEKHRYAEEGFASVRPAMARGGLFIGCSTIDKTNLETFPKKIWNDAKKGINGFIPIFWGYHVVPGRDETTYARDTAGMPDWMREGEYPRDESELMKPPKAMGYFNHEILDKILNECRNPVEQRYDGLVKIYTGTTTNRKFIMALDASEGKDDPSCCIVSDAETNEDVACYHGKISLDQQAKLAWDFYKEYNEPLVCPERNASGLTLIEKLTNLGVKNWYYSDKDRQKIGWYTGSRGENRTFMLQEFAEEVHLRRKRIPIKDVVLQMYDFAWINNKPQAIKGRHDDWVMCEAILNQAKKQTGGGIRITTANLMRRPNGH